MNFPLIKPNWLGETMHWAVTARQSAIIFVIMLDKKKLQKTFDWDLSINTTSAVFGIKKQKITVLIFEWETH